MSEETSYWQELVKLDKVLTQPARLAVLDMLEDNGGKAEFQHLRSSIGLTGGNLGTHLAKLEEAGLVEIEKRFVHKRPRTIVTLTEAGEMAMEEYWTRMAEWTRRRKKRRGLSSLFRGRDR